jgi:hypothetical protein
VVVGVQRNRRAHRGKRGGGFVPVPIERAEGTRKETIVPAPKARGVGTPDVDKLVARLEKLERFGAELRRRVRELVGVVEEKGRRG